MKLSERLKLWKKARDVKKSMEEFEKQKIKFEMSLRKLRDNMVEYINLLYKLGLIDTEKLIKQAKEEAREIMRKQKEEISEKLKYIG